MHRCEVVDLDVKWKDYSIEHGGAILKCYEALDDWLYVSNDEYGNKVNYCPFCGYKGKKQIKFKK